MSRFSEQTLRSWERPASENEEQRISNAIRMIKDAIDSSENLKFRRNNIEIFIQGSYANNTNVRSNSDVDVCIMLKEPFFSIYPNGMQRENYGFVADSYSFNEFRIDLLNALQSKFSNVVAGNKSLKISSNSYRVEADAIPAFQYRNYEVNNSYSSDNFVEGIKFYTANSTEVINYPKQHIANGKEKIE